jgi:capsular polysaccharide biosynthesis protein
MRRFIKVGLPENFHKSDVCQFREHKYELLKLNTFLLEDVTITNEGICFIHGSLIEQSVHWYRDKIEIFRLQGLLCLMDFPTQKKDDSQKYFMIQGPVFNYYHWIIESLPRLLASRKYSKEVTLILPYQTKDSDFVNESLNSFVFGDIIYMPKQTNFFMRSLIMPQINPYFTSYNPRIICKTRDFYKKNIFRNYSSEIPKPFKRIYLLNNDIRQIANEREIIFILEKNDFKVIDLSEYSFSNHVHLLNNAEVVVSSNQDLFACINFLKPGSKVLELKTERQNESDFYFERYWYLSSCLGLKYFYQFCNPSYPLEYEEISNLKVDIKLFKKNLNLLIG